MKKILVPTDFSPNADKALDFALHIARLNKGEIVLIHAAETYPVEEAIMIAREKLALIRKSISETESIDITTEVYADSSINSIFDAASNAIKSNKLLMVYLKVELGCACVLL